MVAFDGDREAVHSLASRELQKSHSGSSVNRKKSATLAPDGALHPTREKSTSRPRAQTAASLLKLQKILGEEAPAAISLDHAPILGDSLIRAVQDNKGSGLPSPSQIQRDSGISGIAEKLQDKLQEHEANHKKGFLRISFAEPQIEHSFRKLTLEVQRREYGLMLGLISFAFLIVLCSFDIIQLLEPAKFANISEYEQCANASADLQRWFYSCDKNCRFERLVWFRVAMILLSSVTGILIQYTGRRTTLLLIVLWVWSVSLLNDLAMYQYHVHESLESDCDPKPSEKLVPLIMIMGIYTISVPGVPFLVALICGWGVVIVSFTTHVLLWVVTDDRFVSPYWDVLYAQLTREALFNLFGTFMAYEYVQQLRLNYWHTRFLKEAAIVQKQVRGRIHRLTSNTLPEPIVKAIAAGDYHYCNVYQKTTVLQADMVGFTVLSSKHPPERVLGILSDIFEQFDTLCEEHRVDKVKTIGDAYIVCAGALATPCRDDAVRVVRMAMGMQKIVKIVAEKEGVDVAVRIGVHTGIVTGGIIGTVRFHFDMWGSGVNGSVKMEEMGERFRVHISNTTHELVASHFHTTRNISVAALEETDKQLYHELNDLGITQTYMVDAERECAMTHEKSSGRDGRDRDSVVLDGVRPSQLSADSSGGLQIESVTAKKAYSTMTSSLLGGGRKNKRESRGRNEILPDSVVDIGTINTRDRASSDNFFVDNEPRDMKRTSKGKQALRSSMHLKSSCSMANVGPPTVPASPCPRSARTTMKCLTKSASTVAPPPLTYTPSRTMLTSGSSSLPQGGCGNANIGRSLNPKINASTGLPRAPELKGAASYSASTDTPRAESHPVVRAKMQEEVMSTLRRTSVLSAIILLSFSLYDYFEWRSNYIVRGYTEAMYIMLLIRIIGVLPTAGGAAGVLYFVPLKGPQMQVVNLLLIMGPFITTTALIFFSPDRNPQYMMCLTLFQVWYGYTTLSLSTTMLMCILMFISGMLILVASVMTEFEGINNTVRPGFDRSLTPQDLNLSTLLGYLTVTHVFMLLHNRKRRKNLRNHAKLLFQHQINMAVISEEVDQCQALLQNIFPPEVLERLHDKQVTSFLSAQIPTFQTESRAGKTKLAPTSGLAERFEDCTFLFAKVVGLKKLTELTESQSDEQGDPVDPAVIVNILQLIFDRFDQLADTFKVQKIRKTVNEYYMVAAGLPDPLRIEDPKERALAIAALAFSMVHVMDVINSEPELKQLNMKLQAQIGIHSGTAIAGIIGHKRFQYDLCGDAVNTAARMCAYAAPGCIGLSSASHALITEEYDTLYRGEKAVKGKGNMKLFFLVGRTNIAMKELQTMIGSGETHVMAPPLALPAPVPPKPSPAALDGFPTEQTSTGLPSPARASCGTYRSGTSCSSSPSISEDPEVQPHPDYWESEDGVRDLRELSVTSGVREYDDTPTMLMPSRSKSLFARGAMAVASVFSGPGLSSERISSTPAQKLSWTNDDFDAAEMAAVMGGDVLLSPAERTTSFVSAKCERNYNGCMGVGRMNSLKSASPRSGGAQCSNKGSTSSGSCTAANSSSMRNCAVQESDEELPHLLSSSAKSMVDLRAASNSERGAHMAPRSGLLKTSQGSSGSVRMLDARERAGSLVHASV